jgi:hypothetical protein
MRTEFRFPVWTISLMLLSLLGVVFAIEQAHRFAAHYSDVATATPLWATVPRIVLPLLGLICIGGVAGYAILVALRRTGTHRLSDIRIGPEQR